MYFYNIRFYFVSISYFTVNLLQNQNTLYFFQFDDKKDEKIARHKSLCDNRIFYIWFTFVIKVKRKCRIMFKFYQTRKEKKEGKSASIF